MRAHRATRGGFGVLFGVIVVFLVVLLTMGLAQMVFGTRVATGTQTSIVGTIAVQLAHSAAEEAWRGIALRANDMADPLYRHLRKSITDPRQSVAKFDVPIPETLREIKETEGYSGFGVDGDVAKAEILGAGTMAGLTYENMGTFKLTVRVIHKPTDLSRTLHVTRGFKVALLSTPRPFDQTTLFIMNPATLLDVKGPAGANDNIRRSVDLLLALDQQDRLKTKNRIIEVNNKVNEESQAYTTQQQQAGQQVQAFSAQPADRWTNHLDKARIITPPQYTDKVEEPFHYFPPVPGDYVVYSLKDEIPDLQRYNLVPRIERVNEQIQQLTPIYLRDYDAVWAKLNEIETAWNNDDSDYHDDKSQHEAHLERLCQALAQSMNELAALHEERLRIYKDFTDFFSERAGDGAKALREFAPKFLVDATQKNRAFFALEGEKAGVELRDLLDRFDQAGKPFNAVIHIDTGGRPLRFEKRKLHGKLVLLVTGDLSLSEVELRDPETDLFTAQVEGLTTVDGKVEGSIVAGKDLKILPGSQIIGNLIVDDIYSAGAFQGSVKKHARYRSSAGGEAVEQLQGHLVVALSPKPASTVVERE